MSELPGGSRRQEIEWLKRRLSEKQWLQFEKRWMQFMEMVESGEWEKHRQRFLEMLESDDPEEYLKQRYGLGKRFPGDSSRN
jgi:hypothetical protein